MSMPDERQIWEALNDIRERVTRIESGIAAYMDQVSERCRVRESRLERLEARVDAVEKKVWQIVGASAALSSVGTALASAFIKGMMQ